MSKFKVLEYIETPIVWLGIRFHRVTEPVNEFFVSFMPHYLVFVSISAVVSTGMFIYSNWPNLEVILQSSTIIFNAMIQVTGMFLSFGSQMKHVKTLHFRLQDIVNKQGTATSVFFYYKLISYN